MRIIVAGGGSLGENLSNVLVKEKHDVVLIEKDEKTAEELAEKLDALVLKGDASDRNVLKDANIKKADAVVAITSDDKTNLLVAEIAKESKVAIIVARVNDSSNQDIFLKLGISASIDTTNSSVSIFKKALEKPGKNLGCLIGGGKGEVFDILVKNDKSIGKKVDDFAEKNFSIAAIYRDGELIIAKPEVKLKQNDIITVCVPLEEVQKVENMFS